MIAWGIALFFATLGIDLTTDYLRYVGREAINHVRGAWLRCIGLLPAGIFLSIRGGGWHWELAIAAAPAIIFVYWSLFDPGYGILIGQGPGYIGTTGKLDQLQHKYPLLETIKYVGALISLAVYIILVL